MRYGSPQSNDLEEAARLRLCRHFDAGSSSEDHRYGHVYGNLKCQPPLIVDRHFQVMESENAGAMGDLQARSAGTHSPRQQYRKLLPTDGRTAP
jgi:hypothetical protein